jgi:hypothetical protein
VINLDPSKKIAKGNLEERVTELEKEVKELKKLIGMLNNRTSGLVRIGGVHF